MDQVQYSSIFCTLQALAEPTRRVFVARLIARGGYTLPRISHADLSSFPQRLKPSPLSNF